MEKKDLDKIRGIISLLIIFSIIFFSNPGIGVIIIVIAVAILKNNSTLRNQLLAQFSVLMSALNESAKMKPSSNSAQIQNISRRLLPKIGSVPAVPSSRRPRSARILQKGKKYLQVALNGTISQAREVLFLIPDNEKIIIEAGTPLIKSYGIGAVREISYLRPNSYIVADIKTADLAQREVVMCSQAGASAVTCLGVAPVETINEFISACEASGVDSMVDMMNVENPLMVLKKLKKAPSVVILHRGVDETESSEGKMIPFYQIKKIKGNYNILVSVAGGDTLREVQSAIFNSADIVVVWKNFAVSDAKTAQIAQGFLKEIK